MDAMKGMFSRPQSGVAEEDQPPKRMVLPVGERLATITESGADGQTRSNRYSRRSLQLRSSALGLPSENSETYTTIWSEGSSQQEKDFPTLINLRENKQVARRGGWKRLLALVALAVATILALVLGLVFGLRSSNNNNSDRNNAAGDSSGPTTPQANNFPAGLYTLSTHLSTVSTNCTSDSSTWSCRPYTAFAQDATKSLAMFNWNISSTSSDGYRISSTDPLSVIFNNVALKLVGKDTDEERYTFEITEDKKVIPTSSLTSDNAATVCFYNGTTFEVSLYTKLARNYPTDSVASSQKASYELWPYAVSVEESIAGGSGVPNCYKTVNGAASGSPIESSSLKAKGTGDRCSCLYTNTTP